MAQDVSLAPAALALIARLGGQAPVAPPADPAQVNGHSVPAPLRQLLAVAWPDATFASSPRAAGRSVWLVRFGLGFWIDPAEIRVADRGARPLYGIGQTDGGNYLLAIDLADPEPADPLIYQLDHDDADQTLGGVRLSAFLRDLRAEPAPR
ncbi:MAG TPA: hypothetical protein VGE07_13645 [Herpetosiphonaceae bacterium]